MKHNINSVIVYVPNTIKRLASGLLALMLIISFSLMPTAADAQACGATSIAPTAQIAAQTIAGDYQVWKATYVTANGATVNGEAALRVQRSASDTYDTVSEGIGYGMLFAAYNNDKTTFDKLWTYEQAHLDANGLMNWRINAGGYTQGYNAATDADEDMAMALVTADKTWGGYTEAASHQIGLIRQYEVESGTYALKPGDVWGGSGQLNPSYLSPGYYTVFKTYTGDTSWADVAHESYTILDAIQQNTAAGATGLVPDWSTASGQPTAGMSFNYGYDAVRSPIRLAIASNWFCDSAANSVLNLLNPTFQTIGLKNIVNGYTLNAAPIGTDRVEGGFLAPVAAAAMASDSSAYRSSAWTSLVASPSANYYSDSLKLFGLLVASGSFTNPLATPSDATPTTAVAPENHTVAAASTPATSTTASINIWWPGNGITINGVQPFKALLTGSALDSYDMYWQVDGGQLNAMATNQQDAPHKQANVNVSGWNWRGTGPYKLTFVAKDVNGNILATASTSISVSH